MKCHAMSQWHRALPWCGRLDNLILVMLSVLLRRGKRPGQDDLCWGCLYLQHTLSAVQQDGEHNRTSYAAILCAFCVFAGQTVVCNQCLAYLSKVQVQL